MSSVRLILALAISPALSAAAQLSVQNHLMPAMALALAITPAARSVSHFPTQNHLPAMLLGALAITTPSALSAPNPSSAHLCPTTSPSSTAPSLPCSFGTYRWALSSMPKLVSIPEKVDILNTLSS